MSATSGGIEVTPGFQPDPNGETITWDKIVRLISDAVLRVQAASIGPREIIRNSITADELAIELTAQLGVPNKSITLGKLADGFLLPISLGGTGATTAASARTSLGVDAAVQYLHVRDEKSSGTSGGAFTAATWMKRVFNVVKINTITGASFSTVDSQATLPAGTYRVCARCPASISNAGFVGGHRAKLYNVTADTDLILGSGASSAYSSAVQTDSFVTGLFTLTEETVLEVRHRSFNGAATAGLGLPVNDGGIEVYSEMMIEKIA